MHKHPVGYRAISGEYRHVVVGTIVHDLWKKYLAANGVFLGNISVYVAVERFSFQWTPVNQVLDKLARATGCTWNIDDDWYLDFIAPPEPEPEMEKCDPFVFRLPNHLFKNIIKTP